MTDVLKSTKKIFTVGVVVTTIMWSLGVAALLPKVTKAAVCPTLVAGDMIKVVGKPAIYAVNKDLKVLYFPSGDEFKSWTALSPTAPNQYAGYISVTQECFDSLPVPNAYPAAVNYRAGSYVVKRPSSDQLYAVLPGNGLAKITPADAAALYGANYKVMTVADMFWPHYVNRGADVAGKAHEGMLVSKDGKTWYIDASNVLREVTASGMSANRFKAMFVRSVPASYVEGFTTGAVIDAMVSSLANRTQDGTIVSTPTTPTTGGAVTVSLAADNPAARNLADGSAYNDVLKLNLTAGSQAVKVTGVTLTKTGLIANTNITGVSVWDKAGYRHGDVMTSLTADNTITVGFASNPIMVAAGTTETLLVKVNISATANSGLVGFKVTKAADISSDGTVGGSFPIEGNQMNIVDGNASLASTTITAQGVGGASVSTASGNVEVGMTQKELGKFRFTENSGNEEVVIQSLTFYFEGSLQDKDLKNITVYAPDNSVLGKVETMKERYATVMFTNPYTLPKSTSRDLSVKADIVDGSSRTMRVHIQNDYDVMLKGATTGFNMLPANFSDQRDTSTGWFIVKSGTLTVNKSAGSISGQVSAGAQNIVLAKFDLKAVGEDMEIRKMGLGVDRTGASGSTNLTGNVIVRDAATGAVYLSTAASAAAVYGSATQYNLSSYINVKSNETKVIEVLGSVDSAATSGMRYQVGVGNFYARRLSSLDFADNLPTSGNTSTAANQLSVNTTSITCNKDSSMADVTRAPGATTNIGQYVCTAGTSEDVRLTGVTVAFGNLSGIAANMFQNMSLWDGSTQLGSTLSTVASSSNSYTFDLLVPKGSTKTLVLKAYIVSGATGSVSSSFSSYNYVGKDSGTSGTGSTVIGQYVTVGSGTATFTAVTDASTISKVYGPAQSGVQVGKWKLAAANDNLRLTKITFRSVQNGSGSDTTTLGNYAMLSLWNDSTKLAEAPYVTGDVTFSGLDLNIPMDNHKFLTLKANTTASGVLTNNTATAFAIKSDSNTEMEIRDGAGSLLAVGSINGSASNRLVTSTYYMFHDAYPVMAPVSLGSALTIGSNVPIFKFTVTNPGTRDLRVATTTVTVVVTGLTSNGTATGSIGNWRLYEDNGSGGLGTQLAATTSLGIAGGVTLATESGYVSGAYQTSSTLNILFGVVDDVASMFESLLVSPGATRTFIVTADTSRVTLGKGSNSVTVSVSGKITGSTGWDGTGAWNTGNMNYHYTPVGGSENTTAYTHSDSYDVLGGTLSITF